MDMMATSEREAFTPEPVDRMRVDAVDVKPVNIDWREAYGDDCEGWQSWEAIRCDECGRVHVVTAGDEEECTGPGFYADRTCPECEASPMVRDDHVWICPVCEHETTAPGEQHKPETLYSEGPMMNYWYPLDGLEGNDAAKLDGLCLAVVEVNGETGLALTGGGMDLSWEICEAFMRLGYLPPLHFAQLPRMADRPPLASVETYGAEYIARSRWIARGCQRAGEVAAGWAQRVADNAAELLALG